MRPSQKPAILEAALTIMATAEGGEITLDAVAREAGITRAGLLYHFPNREVLLMAIVDRAAASIEESMTAVLGKPLEVATVQERLLAYVDVAAHGEANRAEFAIYAEAAYRPELTQPWVIRMGRWLQLPDDLDLQPEARARLHAARLAADGLWGAQATGLFALRHHDLAATVAAIRHLIETTPS